MNRWILNILGLTAITALALSGWAAFRVGRLAESVSVAADNLRLPDLTPTLDRANQTLDSLTPAISKADTAFGNLANATGDWSEASKAQARDVRTLLAAGGRTLDALTEDAQTIKAQTATVGSAATGALQEATTDLQTANGSIQAFQPLLSHSDAILEHMDERITSFAPLETNLTNVTAHMSQITFDGQQVSDDATRKYFEPMPWYKKALSPAVTAFKIARLLPW